MDKWSRKSLCSICFRWKNISWYLCKTKCNWHKYQYNVFHTFRSDNWTLCLGFVGFGIIIISLRNLCCHCNCSILCRCCHNSTIRNNRRIRRYPVYDCTVFCYGYVLHQYFGDINNASYAEFVNPLKGEALQGATVIKQMSININSKTTVWKSYCNKIPFPYCNSICYNCRRMIAVKHSKCWLYF